MITRILLSAGIAAIPVLTVCVFTPMLIYSGNPTEFTASFVELVAAYAPYMLAIVGICALLGGLMTDAGLARYLSILSALAVLLWLQGNILVWDYGALDGRRIDWFAGLWRGVLDSIIWISVALFAIYSYQRFALKLRHAAIAVCVIQFLSAGLLLAGSNTPELTNSDVVTNQEAKEAVFRFSETRNVVHIVMDGFQSDMFSEIINDPQNAAFTEELQGFTFFQDNLGIFPYTQMTVPALLSGKIYRNDVPINEFIDSTLADTNIFSAVTDAGFEVDIAAPVALKNTYAKGTHENAYGISRSDHVSAADYIVNDSARLLDLSLFRVVPHFAKPLVHRDELWVFQAMVRSESYLQMQYFSDLAFIRELTEKLRVDRQAPVYKIMHLMLSHRPTVGNERCEYDGTRPTNRATVTVQATCGLKAVLGLLARMKEQGIYDSSLIILMADHGAWVPVESIGSRDGYDAIGSVDVAMAIPLLAIKRPDETKAFNVSHAQTSILDLPQTVADVLRLDEQFTGASVFAIDPEQSRSRLHYTYLYGLNKDHNDYLNPMHELFVEGSPYDAGSWQRGRRYLPEGVTISAESRR